MSYSDVTKDVSLDRNATLSVSTPRYCQCHVQRVESVTDVDSSSSKVVGVGMTLGKRSDSEIKEGQDASTHRVKRSRPENTGSVVEGVQSVSPRITPVDVNGPKSSGLIHTGDVYLDVSKPQPFGKTGSGGVAATILGIPPGAYSVQAYSQPRFGDKVSSEHSNLPHNVLQVIATTLQCDIVIAAILQNPLRLAETVLCIPKGLITVPLRFSKSALQAASRCEVLSTEGLLLPSMLSTVLGARPKRFLATLFHAEGYEGLCYSLWLDPSKVPDAAEAVMAEAGQSLPLLLASSVRALCCDRMGRRFDVILKKMPQAVVFVDDDRGQCLINPLAAQLLGLPSPGEYYARKVAEGMRHLADRSSAAADVYRCFSMLAGNPDQIRDWIWELKHPRCVLRVRSYPITNNATHGRVWLFDDVTSERDAHDAIEEANMAKSQFLAMMSHELRTPMTGVLGMLDLLRLTSLTEEQARFLGVMQGSAEGLMQVLNEILDFSKIQSGHLALEDSDFRINELLEQVSALFEGRVAEKMLTLTTEMPSKEEMFVHGDPNRLRQVLSNLVSNAIKFTEEGGITISWRRAETCLGSICGISHNETADAAETLRQERINSAEVISGGPDDVQIPSYDSLSFPLSPEVKDLPAPLLNCAVELEVEENMTNTEGSTKSVSVDKRIWYEVRVTDTGIGLTKEQQGRLFQSFSQADSSTTRKFGGTGLGLAICKGLVGVMGGKIWVESEPEQGSTFAFCVPLLPGADESERVQSCEKQTVKKFVWEEGEMLKVLVAEDNMVNQLLIGKMLRHYGHDVKLVGNGQLAVEAVQSGQYDMILMDLQMPVLDGLSATKAIRALGGQVAKLPIYALTADVLSKGKESPEAMGLDGYLTKPINWDILSQVIDTVGRAKCRAMRGEDVGSLSC